MAGRNQIDAKLRIASDVADAIRDQKALRRELAATRGEVQKPAAGGGAAQHQATADREAIRQRLAAEREAAREARRLAAEEARRKRQADAEDKRRLREQQRLQQQAQNQERYRRQALAPQLTDVVTGLAGGQNPGMVLLQQGGQIRDLYGGVVPAFRALLSMLSPMRVLVGGVAAGFVAMAAGIASGYRESQQLNKALALTGNVAATTARRVSQVAEDVSAQQQVGIGVARELVAGLVSMAGQTDATLQSTAAAAAALSRLTGESADEALAHFEDQAKGITDWSVKANSAYHFLTAAQVDHVRALEREGRTAEAVRFVNEQLAGTMQQRTAVALGTVEKAWDGVTRAMSRAWEVIKGIGREQSPSDRLAEIQGELAGRMGRRSGLTMARRQQLEAEAAAINRTLLQQTEGAIDMRAEEERIKRESADFQQALAAQGMAGAKLRLAQRERELDSEAALLRQNRAQELIGEQELDRRLNGIAQARARERLRLAEAERASQAELLSSTSSPKEVVALQTRLTELDAAVVSAKAEVDAAIADGTRLLAEDATRQANAWQQAWQRAFERTRSLAQQNAQSTADAIADPQERAREQARLASEDLRRELREQLDGSRGDSLQFRINLTIDPQEAAKLQQQLDALRAQTQTRVGQVERDAALASYRQSYATLLDELRLKEEQLTSSVEQGSLTTQAAEREKFAARQRALPQLQALAQALAALARSPEERQTARETAHELDELGKQATEVEVTLRGAGRGALAGFFNDLTTGAKSGKRALLDMLSSFAQAMLDLLNKRLAEQLFKQLEGAGNSGGGGWLQSVGTWIASAFHTGGVVGAGRGMARAVSPLVFAGAQVLHGGGLAGLRRNEVPAVLEEGEEVLTEDDPRHRNNFRGSGVSIGAINVGVTIQQGDDAGEMDRQTAYALGQRLKDAVRSTIANEQRPGGLLARG